MHSCFLSVIWGVKCLTKWDVCECSATVFGVSTESMQLSYDTRGNIVPTILLMMQSHLYSRGGLQVVCVIVFQNYMYQQI